MTKLHRILLLSLLAAATPTLSNATENPEYNTQQPDGYGETYISGPDFIKKKVTYEKRDGLAYFEGDILLGTVADAEAWKQQVEQSMRLPPPPSVAIGGEHYRWENSTLPYQFHSSVTSATRSTMLAAIQHWREKTPVKFVERTAANSTQYPDYVEITSEGIGCSSAVGRIGGKQSLQVSTNCGFGSHVHELGHALGLFHEQSRADRDNYVTVYFANILMGSEHNFNQEIYQGVDLGVYDYNSIMHYHAYAFAKDTSKPTIVPKDPNAVIGQRNGLSALDIEAINMLYGACVAQPQHNPWGWHSAWYSFNDKPEQFIGASPSRGTKNLVDSKPLLFGGVNEANQQVLDASQPAYESNGFSRAGLRFDGLNDSAFSYDSPKTAIVNSTFVLEGAVKLDSNKLYQKQTIMAKWNNNVGFWFGTEYGVFKLTIGTKQGIVQHYYDTTLLKADQWQHFVVNFVGYKSIVEFYVNGKLNYTHNIVGMSTTPDLNSSAPLMLGALQEPAVANMPWTRKEFFAGVMDEVTMYSGSPLSATQVQAIYQAKSIGKCRPASTTRPAGLSAFFVFDKVDMALTSNGNALSYYRDVMNNVLYATTIGDQPVAPSIVGHGLQFNGVNQNGNIQDRETINAGVGDFSIEFWVQTTKQNATILSKQTASATTKTGYSVNVVNGRLAFTMSSNGKTATYQTNPTHNLSDGKPYHVVISVDRDQLQGGKIYINGTSHFTFDPTIVSGTLTNTVGMGLSPDYSFGGMLDELSFYKRALTGTEAYTLHRALSAGKHR